MELLVVRHGRPREERTSGGFADPELNELGHSQSAALADYMESLPVDHIVASPMKRAYQTAEPLAQRLGFDIEVIDDLKESDYEAEEYLPVEENRDAMIEMFQNDPDSIFGNDGREVFFNRVQGAFRSVAEANGGRTVAVFCHGMVTAALMCMVTGSDEPFDWSPDYTGLTRIRCSFSRDIWSLRSFNETMHLRDLPDVRW